MSSLLEHVAQTLKAKSAPLLSQIAHTLAHDEGITASQRSGCQTSAHRLRTWRAAMVGALMASATVLVSAPTTFAQQADPVPVEALQRGGYVIYFRHAMTDSTQKEASPVPDLANCSTQRNLTAAGRDQARVIGDVFRARNIPVGQVLSSELCRALDTARLAFGRAETAPPLLAAVGISDAERRARTEGVRKLLAAVPPPGTNVVLVSHKENIQDATATELPTEGEMAIFSPDGQGGFKLVAKILPSQWAGVNLPRARDGQSLTTQAFAARASFATVWGPQAAAEWVAEHEMELARLGR